MRVTLLALWLPMAACAIPNALATESHHAERVAAAQAAYTATLSEFKAGSAALDDVYTWSARWHHAQSEAGDPSAAATHLARMESLSGTVEASVAAGATPPSAAHAAKYYVAEARVWRDR